MPYQPYQSTWQNPYLQQIQQPQYNPVVPSVTTPYTQPSQYQQQPMAQQMSGVVKVDGPDEAMIEQYFNITCTANITVPKGCCYTVAVENVDAGVGGTIVDQQTISVADGNLVVTRTA